MKSAACLYFSYAFSKHSSTVPGYTGTQLQICFFIKGGESWDGGWARAKELYITCTGGPEIGNKVSF
jgi:hypothetical protein